MKQIYLFMLMLVPLTASAELVIIEDEAPVAVAQFAPAPPPKEVWVARPGSTLHTTVETWVKKAGWTLVWDTKTDYEVLASLQFEGDIDEAIAQWIRLYEASEAPLWVSISKQQRLINVTSRKPQQ